MGAARLLLAALAFLPGCLLPPVTRTERPDVPLGPWEPRAVRSTATGLDYAYLHLPESIRRFPPPGRVAELLGEAGFSEIAYRRLTDGIAVIYRGVKR